MQRMKKNEKEEEDEENLFSLSIFRILPTFPTKISALTGRACVFHCYTAVAMTCEKAFDLQEVKGNLVQKICGKGGMNG